MNPVTGRVSSRPLRYVVAAAATVFVVAAGSTEIAGDLAASGYYVDSGVSATDVCVSESVDDARNSGGTLYVAVLADEPTGGAAQFSRDMLAALDGDGTVFIVAPKSLDYADSEEFWTADELDRALAEANTVASDNDVVRTFVNELAGLDGVCAGVSLDGRSGWAYLVMMVMIVVGVGYFAVASIARARRRGSV
jgi:hypothetical protein